MDLVFYRGFTHTHKKKYLKKQKPTISVFLHRIENTEGDHLLNIYFCDQV